MPAGFVEWREEIVSHERGSRLVHYFLDGADGASHLAVVGTEKSIRHMFYVVAEDFCREYGASRPGVSGLKWRSRREVVHWLASWIPRRSKSLKSGSEYILDGDMRLNGVDDPESYQCGHPDLGRNLKAHESDIVWSGASWVCGKQLRHFQAFHRNGTTIPSHSFVLVLSEKENRHLAYLEDMYEDKKGQKKVKVRWFHRYQEIQCTIPPPKPHPREVFITPYFQVISAECVDDLATVLTPDHYDKCFAALPHVSSAGIHLCFRQYKKNRFKSYDLTSLSGYFDQAVFSCFSICTLSGDEGLGNEGSARDPSYKRNQLAKGPHSFVTGSLTFRLGNENHVMSARLPCDDMRYGLPVKKPMSLKFVGPRQWLTPPYKVDEKIELLCQDSGIRGCWFRCTVLQSSQKRLKVRYDDVFEEDGCGNLEEWVPAFRPATPDKLGMRCPGRLTIRPSPLHNNLPDDVALQIGTSVDAWWNDGWWEGVVIGVSSGDDSAQLYFPGEDLFLICKKQGLRIAREWMRNQWVDLDVKPDILSAISMVSSGPTFSKRADSGSSAMSNRAIGVLKFHMDEEDRNASASLSSDTDKVVENVEQANPRKRCRNGLDEAGEDGGGGHS